MQRIPLRRGTSVAIDGKSYVIGDVIGEGGFSYIYATEPSSGTDVVIKEYYPASGALRDERTQRVLPAPGQETVFQQNLAHHPYTLPKSAERSSRPRFVCDSFLDIFLVLDFLLQQLGRFATCFESFLPVGHSLVDFAQHKQNITVMLEQLRTRLFRLIQRIL